MFYLNVERITPIVLAFGSHYRELVVGEIFVVIRIVSERILIK
jgi:hypothetical protein